MNNKKTSQNEFKNDPVERFLKTARGKILEAFEHNLNITTLLNEYNHSHTRFSYSLKRDSEDIKNRLTNY